MKLVLVMFKGDQRRDFQVTRGETVIGRRQDCGLRIQTADVSRRHCIISVEDDHATIQDLESANGTFVNGVRVTETALNPGDRIKIGPAVFVAQVDGEPAEIKPDDTAIDLVDLDPANAPTRAKAAADDDDDAIELTEDDLFEVTEGGLDDDDPISAMEAILDDDEDDEDRA